MVIPPCVSNREVNARGIAPPATGGTEEWDTAATSVLAPTEATRAAPRTGTRRAVPREPVPARRAAAAPAAAPARERPAKRRRSPTQVILLLLILALIGAGIGVLVASSSGGNDKVQLRQVDYPDFNQSLDAMKGLVEDNTR